MAKFNRIQVATTMNETGIVPVFYHADVEICKEIIRACYEGGVRVFEFTNRGDFAHDVFGELVRHCRTSFPDLMLGIGSVVDAATAALYIQSGADFIVSPVVQKDMAIVCNRRKILWVPGCGSLTEISTAEELGAEVVKMFPAGQVGGPKFLAAVKGPSPWSSIMPTGGVEPTEESLKAWFDAGAHCVGIGSQLINKDLVNTKDYQGLLKLTRSTIEIIQKVRKKQ